MPWVSNPLLRPAPTLTSSSQSQSPEDPEGSLSQSESSRGIPGDFRPPSESFTLHQIFYIFVLDGLGSSIISGAINFAIAYGMYSTVDTTISPITLWKFPNTLAGDGALSIPVQCVLTWWIELWLVNRDLRRGNVQAMGFVPEPRSRILRWFVFLDRRGQDHETGSWRHWALFAGSQFTRALLVSAVCFVVVWPPSVLVLMVFAYKCCHATAAASSSSSKCGGGVVDGLCYQGTWGPQLFKAARGSVLGLLTTPLFVMFWLVRCGWALKTKEAQYCDERRGLPMDDMDGEA